MPSSALAPRSSRTCAGTRSSRRDRGLLLHPLDGVSQTPPRICYRPVEGYRGVLTLPPTPAIVATLVAIATVVTVLARMLWTRLAPPPPLSPGRARGLATAALIVEVNHGRHDLLG